jgi:hypothetical protein
MHVLSTGEIVVELLEALKFHASRTCRAELLHGDSMLRARRAHLANRYELISRPAFHVTAAITLL